MPAIPHIYVSRETLPVFGGGKILFKRNQLHPMMMTPPMKALAKKPSTYLPRLIPAMAIGSILKSNANRYLSDSLERKPIMTPTYNDMKITASHPPFQ